MKRQAARRTSAIRCSIRAARRSRAARGRNTASAFAPSNSLSVPYEDGRPRCTKAKRFDRLAAPSATDGDRIVGIEIQVEVGLEIGAAPTCEGEPGFANLQIQAS